MTRVRVLLALLVLAAIPPVVLALEVFPSGAVSAANPMVAAPKSTFSLAAAREFSAFPLFSLGAEFEGIPLVAVLRRVDTTTDRAEPIRANYVSFIYGTCDPYPDGCAPPLEVQIWPACVRNPNVISYVGIGQPQTTTIRGVPAVYVDPGDGGGRLELTTGSSTVVLFGSSREQLERAARALRGVNVDVPMGSPLPVPGLGAAEGALTC